MKKKKSPRGETLAKQAKREEYAELSDADRATLIELGVKQVDELVCEYRKLVLAITYLHTRRQRILCWLAESPLFPLIEFCLLYTSPSPRDRG